MDNLSFGVIADLQYCDSHPEYNRYFRNAPVKLDQSITEFNKHKLDFIINLGDTIDRNWSSYDGILPHFNKANAPLYHVLGNHDFEVDNEYKSQVPEKIGTSRYYDFNIEKWRFIILDGNEISTYANLPDSENYKVAKNLLKEGKVNSNFWNGALGLKQLEWLEEKLKNASSCNENTIIFCHFPIYPTHRHNLLNDIELMDIIAKFDSVKAFICGHNHEGNYGQLNGVHFINLKGIVDTEHQLAFGIVRLYGDRIELQGFGSEISAKLII